MRKMQPYVKQWYDFLAQDKIMGLKCERCNNLEFPPVPICNNCSGTDLEWYEINGEGEMNTFSICAFPEPWMAEYGVHIQGCVTLKEGATFHSMVSGVDPTDTEGLFQRLPIKVKAVTQQREGYSFIAFQAIE